MPLEFRCEKCNHTIIIQYLKPGEKAICRKCGAENIIPPDAVKTDKKPVYNETPPVFDKMPAEKPPAEVHKNATGTEKPQKPKKPYPGLIQTVQLFFYYTGLLLVIMVFLMIFTRIFGSESKDTGIITTISASAALILTLLIGIYRTNAAGHEVLPLIKFDWKILAFLFIITFGMRCFFAGALSLLSIYIPQLNQAMQTSAEKVLRLFGTGYVFSFIFIVIIGPITEELFFRGLILRGYLQRYGIHKAILYSTLIFGIIHIQPGQIIWGIILGYILGWTFVLTRSLVSCILIHAFSNLTSYLVFFLFMGGQLPADEVMSPRDFITSILLIFLGVVLSIIAFQYLKQRYDMDKAAPEYPVTGIAKK